MSRLIKTQLQQGMATLVITMIVLVIITLMVIFATKVGLLDQRMAGNESRYKEAFVAAEAGLDMAVEKYQAQFANNFTGAASGAGSWATIITNSAIASGTETDGTAADTGEASFGVSIASTGTLIGGINAYLITSTGLSADGTGTATVSREVTMKNILGGSAPDVPIVVNGSVGTGGDFNIVTNPNASGPGVPVSIWTPGPSPTGNVTMSASSATCNIQYYDGNNAQCSNSGSGGELISEGDGSVLTAQTSSHPDIVPNDPGFPDDLFQFLFGVASSDWQTVYDKANAEHQVVADCSTLSATSGQKFRLWWITGGCEIAAGQTVGSVANPVILVIDDNQLWLKSSSSFVYGITYLFNNPTNVATPTAKFSGSPAIYGSFISDVAGTAMNGNVSIVYDQTINDNLSSSTSGANFSMVFVPGSWRDF